MNILSILLTAAQGAKPESGGMFGGMQGILMMVAIIAVFYFLIIRPQSKRQKAIQKQRESLKVGDKVVTSGGIHGRIKEMQEGAVIVEISENVKIKVEKTSVYPSAEDAAAATNAK
ncbi:MAG: preprotein translocase subunit YajC [Prevotellaceae bacterium]|jgi:preprotein translocase subunit YajC|nr:preprotein translocase subunit YajC [Prevotellaceae bacterium]